VRAGDGQKKSSVELPRSRPHALTLSSVLQPNLIPLVVDEEERLLGALVRAGHKSGVIGLNRFEIVDLLRGIPSTFGLLIEAGF
jgi:hypothetical protein